MLAHLERRFYLTIVKDLFDDIPDDLKSNVRGWLVLDSKKALPIPTQVDTFEPLDDMTLRPLDKLAALDTVDKSVTLDLKMDNLADGVN